MDLMERTTECLVKCWLTWQQKKNVTHQALENVYFWTQTTKHDSWWKGRLSCLTVWAGGFQTVRNCPLSLCYIFQNPNQCDPPKLHIMCKISSKHHGWDMQDFCVLTPRNQSWLVVGWRSSQWPPGGRTWTYIRTGYWEDVCFRFSSDGRWYCS